MENQTNYQFLMEAWNAVAAFYCEDQQLIGAVFEDIYRRYAENHRAYHTHQHIVEILQLITGHTEEEHQQVHVLAAFFHDIVYVPGNRDNEWQSCLLATEMMKKLGVPADDIEAVCQVIMATQAHEWFDPSIPN